jgi:hypothetical protein
MSTEDMLTELPLATFELPQWLLQPAVRSCRLFNSIHKWIHGPNLAYQKSAEGLKSRWAPTALFRSVWTTIPNGSWRYWRSIQPHPPSRSQAIRRLIRMGLAAAAEKQREDTPQNND